MRRADRHVAICVRNFKKRQTFAFDPRIELEKDERLTNVAIADPWIAWTTKRADRTTLHRKRLDTAGRPWTRLLQTSPTTVLVTTDGTVVARTPRATNISSYGTNGEVRLLDGLGSASRRSPTGRLALWGTRQVALVTSSIARPFFPGTGRPVTRCTPSAPTETVHRTSDASLRLATATTWAPRNASTRFQMTLCTKDGRRLLSRLLHDDGDYYNDVALAVALSGPLLTINASLVANEGGGTSVETTDRRYVYVRTSGARPTVIKREVSIVVASPAAAAFVERGRLWLSDANGLRQIAFPGSLTAENTRLDLRADNLLVRTPTRAENIPLRPLAPEAFVSPSIATRRAIPLSSADLCGTFSTALGESCGPAPSAIDQPDG